MSRWQRGVTTVEFAIVGLLAMITLFGVLEIARAFFVYNALEEATRRGARVAAVCQVNDPAISEITIFNSSGGSTSAIVSGLTTGNVVVEYLDQTGNILVDPMGSYGLIRYVRVSIAGFTHQLLIPLFASSFTTPSFATTLPAESLGVWPGGFSPC
jgi:Flp pilus assembly protein TadG